MVPKSCIERQVLGSSSVTTTSTDSSLLNRPPFLTVLTSTGSCFEFRLVKDSETNRNELSLSMCSNESSDSEKNSVADIR